MPKKIENNFIKEYGKKKGKLIFFKWRSKNKSSSKSLG
jgi:hypothetical protein